MQESFKSTFFSHKLFRLLDLPALLEERFQLLLAQEFVIDVGLDEVQDLLSRLWLQLFVQLFVFGFQSLLVAIGFLRLVRRRLR